MKTKIYIIPGYGETCILKRYTELSLVLKKIGYDVRCVNPDWKKPLSQQAFRIEKDSIVCGFSFGAIIAYLTVKKYPCKKAIFASMTPINSYSFKDIQKHFSKTLSPKDATVYAKDIKSIKINLKNLTTPHITMAGSEEKMLADILVPKTGHRMTSVYINAIKKVLQ